MGGPPRGQPSQGLSATTRFWKRTSPSVWLHTPFLLRGNYPSRTKDPHAVLFLKDPESISVHILRALALAEQDS